MTDLTRRDFVRGSMATGAAAAAVAASVGGAQPGAAVGGRIKILGISCSPRKGKSTVASLGVCLEAAAKVSEEIETELIELADFTICGNLAAGVAGVEGEQDDFPRLIPKLTDPSVRGIILGTPGR